MDGGVELVRRQPAGRGEAARIAVHLEREENGWRQADALQFRRREDEGRGGRVGARVQAVENAAAERAGALLAIPGLGGADPCEAQRWDRWEPEKISTAKKDGAHFLLSKQIPRQSYATVEAY